jgi:hypothetical protein
MSLDLAEGANDVIWETAEKLLQQEQPSLYLRYEQGECTVTQAELDANQNWWNKLVSRRAIKLLQDLVDEHVVAFLDVYGEEPNAHEDTSTAEAAT